MYELLLEFAVVAGFKLPGKVASRRRRVAELARTRPTTEQESALLVEILAEALAYARKRDLFVDERIDADIAEAACNGYIEDAKHGAWDLDALLRQVELACPALAGRIDERIPDTSLTLRSRVISSIHSKLGEQDSVLLGQLEAILCELGSLNNRVATQQAVAKQTLATLEQLEQRARQRGAANGDTLAPMFHYRDQTLRQHREHFAGREAILDQLDDARKMPGTTVCVGPEGCGKSALLAAWTRPGPRWDNHDLIVHSISAEYPTRLHLLRSVLHQIRIVDENPTPVGFNWEENLAHIQEFLTRPEELARPVTIVIDGLDEATEAIPPLIAPARLRNGIHIVAACASATGQLPMHLRRWDEARTIAIGDLDEDDVLLAIQQHPNVEAARLADPTIVPRLMAATGGYAVFLNRILAGVEATTDITELLETLPEDYQQLVLQDLDRGFDARPEHRFIVALAVTANTALTVTEFVRACQAMGMDMDDFRLRQELRYQPASDCFLMRSDELRTRELCFQRVAKTHPGIVALQEKARQALTALCREGSQFAIRRGHEFPGDWMWEVGLQVNFRQEQIALVGRHGRFRFLEAMLQLPPFDEPGLVSALVERSSHWQALMGQPRVAKAFERSWADALEACKQLPNSWHADAWRLWLALKAPEHAKPILHAMHHGAASVAAHLQPNGSLLIALARIGVDIRGAPSEVLETMMELHWPHVEPAWVEGVTSFEYFWGEAHAPTVEHLQRRALVDERRGNGEASARRLLDAAMASHKTLGDFLQSVGSDVAARQQAHEFIQLMLRQEPPGWWQWVSPPSSTPVDERDVARCSTVDDAIDRLLYLVRDMATIEHIEPDNRELAGYEPDGNVHLDVEAIDDKIEALTIEAEAVGFPENESYQEELDRLHQERLDRIDDARAEAWRRDEHQTLARRRDGVLSCLETVLKEATPRQWEPRPLWMPELDASAIQAEYLVEGTEPVSPELMEQLVQRRQADGGGRGIKAEDCPRALAATAEYLINNVTDEASLMVLERDLVAAEDIHTAIRRHLNGEELTREVLVERLASRGFGKPDIARALEDGERIGLYWLDDGRYSSA